MIMWKRVICFSLVMVLVVAMFPLFGRGGLQPCSYLWHYAISYRPLGVHRIVPGFAFPRGVPLCADYFGLHEYMV